VGYECKEQNSNLFIELDTSAAVAEGMCPVFWGMMHLTMAAEPVRPRRRSGHAAPSASQVRKLAETFQSECAAPSLPARTRWHDVCFYGSAFSFALVIVFVWFVLLGMVGFGLAGGRLAAVAVRVWRLLVGLLHRGPRRDDTSCLIQPVSSVLDEGGEPHGDGDSIHG
jgi:hypothetical protein